MDELKKKKKDNISKSPTKCNSSGALLQATGSPTSWLVAESSGKALGRLS